MNTVHNSHARIGSIDILRGAVMIIMALDHTRDYFHGYSHYFDPADLDHTTFAIFLTRWVTHFCAQVFFFLSGTSAFITGQNKSKKELSGFLLKRGLWLMLLEVTLVSFGWFFNPTFSLQGLQVIWVIGISMIILAALIHLPRNVILAISIILIFGHNLLDDVHIQGNTMAAFAWSQLHEFNIFTFQGITIYSVYPIIPWMGVMALGYCLGSLYHRTYDASKRKSMLLWIGGIGILLFLLIRLSNVYGDPVKWSVQSSETLSIISFLNASKYPPSLLYLLMTLSPALIFLAFSEKVRNGFTQIISTYGRVPLFYYLVHIYLLHLMAIVAAELTGFSWTDMVFTSNWITEEPSLRGYGFSLPIVYLIWLSTVIMLYPICKRYDTYKQNNRSKWWLSYL